MSSLVEYWPVFVFLAFGSSCSLSKSISPTFAGEPTLNVSPASSYISFSIPERRPSRSAAASFSASTSIRTPVISISARTVERGNSTSARSLSIPSETISFCRGSRRRTTTAACSQAHSAISDSVAAGVLAPRLAVSTGACRQE